MNEWVCADYLRDRGDEIRSATWQHLELTVLTIALGLALAVPIALLARRSPTARSAALSVSTALYTIPSVALLPLLVPFTGLSETTVLIGLAIYALTILVRGVLDGLDSVPPEVREAADGLGYGAARRLLRVELPLALPVILAGVRVATVSTVALTTVGALVGYGGLGNLIADGVLTDFRAELLTAAVLCVLLAVALDLPLALLGRVLSRWRPA